MSESFRGLNRTLKVSNGAGEVMLEVLAAVGSQIASTPDELAVSHHLDESLRRPRSTRAFALDGSDPVLAADERLDALGRITAEALSRLSSPDSALDPTLAAVPYAEESRRLTSSNGPDYQLWRTQAVVRSLSRLLNLHDLIAESRSPAAPPLPPPALDLPAAQRRLVEARRLWWNWPQEPRDQLPLLDEMAALLAGAEPIDAAREALLACHEARYDLFLAPEDDPRRLEVLRQMALLVPAEEKYRQSIEEEIEALQSVTSSRGPGRLRQILARLRRRPTERVKTPPEE